MIFIYPAIFHKESESYWIEFPDLEGCQTFGESLKETIRLAQEAMELYIETTLEQGKTLPEPTDISNIPTDTNTFITLITAKMDGYLKKAKAVKKTLTIPQWLNDMAEQQQINFSQTLQNALLEILNINK